LYWFSYYNRGDANSICGKKKKKQNLLMSMCLLYIIVFRPGPVQGPCSGFWPGHWVARVNCFFSNQNDVVLVKKTKGNGLQSGFWPGQPARSTGSHLVFSFSIFSSPGPVLAPGRPGPRRLAGPGRVSKLCFIWWWSLLEIYYTNYNYLFYHGNIIGCIKCY